MTSVCLAFSCTVVDTANYSPKIANKEIETNPILVLVIQAALRDSGIELLRGELCVILFTVAVFLFPFVSVNTAATVSILCGFWFNLEGSVNLWWLHNMF